MSLVACKNMRPRVRITNHSHAVDEMPAAREGRKVDSKHGVDQKDILHDNVVPGPADGGRVFRGYRRIETLLRIENAQALDARVSAIQKHEWFCAAVSFASICEQSRPNHFGWGAPTAKRILIGAAKHCRRWHSQSAFQCVCFGWDKHTTAPCIANLQMELLQKTVDHIHPCDCGEIDVEWRRRESTCRLG